MAAMKKAIETMEQDLADNMEKRAQAEEDLTDTRAKLNDDQLFLVDLTKRCKETDAEYEARTKSRNEEISACADVIAILNNDAAFDTFNRSLDFIQEQTEEQIRTKKVR